MSVLGLVLPLPKTTNKLFANVPGKGRVKTAAYRAWIAAATNTLWGQKPHGGFPSIDGPFAVVITVPVKARGDIDNRIKATLDFLQHAGLVANDKDCTLVTCFRADTVAAGSIYVRLFWGEALKWTEAA